MEKQWEQWKTLSLGAPKSLQMVTAAMKLKDGCSLGGKKKVMTNLDSILKSRDITLPINVHLVKAMVFPVVKYGCESWTIKLSAEELTLLNCGVGEDSWQFLGLQGNPTSPSSRKSALNIYWENWCWSWNSNTLATWCEELTHLKRPWCWERLKAWGERDGRGWDDWTSSPTWWTWVWARSGSWWWTGKPGLLQSMGSQSQTQLSNWIEVLDEVGPSLLGSLWGSSCWRADS